MSRDEFDEDLDDFDDNFSGGGNDFSPSNTSDKSQLVKYALISFVSLIIVYFLYSTLTQSKKNKVASVDTEQTIATKSNSAINDLKLDFDAPINEQTNNETVATGDQMTNELESTMVDTSSSKSLADMVEIEDLLADENQLSSNNNDMVETNNTKFDTFIENQSSNNLIAIENDETNNKQDEVIATLTEEMTLNVNQIKSLESTLNKVNDSLRQMKSDLQGLKQDIDTLQQQDSTFGRDINNIKRVLLEEDLDITKGSNNDNQMQEPLVYNKPDYIVHAIIPGRAWLKSTQGQIITITEGDTLGDYGRIALIDANNNLVKTSSGITLR